MSLIVECDVNPAVYMPFMTGAYRVEAGLHPLQRSFGNDAADQLVFQFDSEFERFRDNGKRARTEGLNKYYVEEDFATGVERPIVSFIVQQLAMEHPMYFLLVKTVSGVSLECGLTGETLQFKEEFRWANNSSGRYVSALDALAAQVQEDLAVVQVSRDGDRLVAVHAVAPGGWDPCEKIGKSFQEVHAPVAGIESLSTKARALFRNVVKGGRYQRFVWGLSPDTTLNRHPDNVESITFDYGDPSLYVRVERQVLIGIETASAFLFCIHPYYLDCAVMSIERRYALRKALLTMTEASREYKGLAASFDDIIEWLAEE